LDAVNRLGYKANRSAKAMRSKRTGVIAVLGVQYDQEGEPFGTDVQIIHNMATVLRQSDLDLCHYFGSGLEDPYGLPDWPVDGVCALNLYRDEDVAKLEQSELPYVSINGLAGPNGVSVLVDDSLGSKLAVDHFVSLGHKRIGYIMESSWTPMHPSVQARRLGYAQAMHSHGLPLLPMWDQTYDMVEEAVAEAYENRCTALLVYSHYTALVVLKYAHEIGLRIPQDMSLICFNDRFPVNHTIPQLTAIALPYKEMADVAAEMLTNAISKKPGNIQSIQIKPELVIRKSAVAPAS
jgi:DNA-binding LacI/PurR family transcriptional regulator